MEILFIVILVVLFFVLKSSIDEIGKRQNSILNLLQHLQDELFDTKRIIAKLKQEKEQHQSTNKATVSEVIITKENIDLVKEETPKIVAPNYEVKKEEFKQKEIPSAHKFEKINTEILEANLKEKQLLQDAETVFSNTTTSQSVWEKFVSKNPDVEKFIGENLINKIGIAVLVFGIAFFIKYAIDKEWINEFGRVGIGVFCGILLIGIAHYLRSSYRSFSSVLVGGGLTVLYFSIGFAFQQYQLFSQTLAFVLVCLITVLALLLCVIYDRIELAIIATIGGFITPFIVSTGSGNYKVLFTYLTILNTGLIALAYLKQWRVVQFIAFIITTAIYSTWLYDRISLEALPIKGAFIFATIFYMLFITMNLLHHVYKKYLLKPADFTLFLSINVAYFTWGILVLEQIVGTNYSGLFTTSLAAVNGLLLWQIFNKKDIDKNLSFLLIGISVTYISLIAPIQFNGVSVVLFWSAEMIVLFWLYQKSNFRLLKIASIIIAVIVLFGLLINITGYDSFSSQVAIIFNKQFITFLFAAICYYVFYLLLGKEGNTFFDFGITTKLVKQTMYLIAFILLFIAGFSELSYQITSRVNYNNNALVCLNVYVIVFALAVQLLHKSASTISSVRGLLFTVIFVLIFKYFTWFFVYDLLEDSIISQKSLWQVVVYFIGEILLYYLFTYAIKTSFKNNQFPSKTNYTLFYTICLLINISLTSLMLFLLIAQPNLNNLEHLLEIYNRAGLSILWGLLSFVAMWLGMKWGNKTLRVFSLILFAITLVKLAIMDIQKMNEGGKIISFILLGVILLTVSFMYQRLKKLIVSEENNNKV